MILLILCALMAGECKVHRNPYTHTAEVGIGCEIADLQLSKPGHIMNFRDPKHDRCVVDSHWFPCTVVEKCDTVVIWEATAGRFLNVDCDSVSMRTYRLENCHPETTLVDVRKCYEGDDCECPPGFRKVKTDSTDMLIDLGGPAWRYDYRCVKDTLVDSGVHRQVLDLLDRPDWSAGNSITYSLTKPLDSSELADLREMPKKLKALSQEIRALRRQIDFRTCLDTLKLRQNGQWYTDPKRPDTTWVTMGMPTVRDSCECVYGDRKGK